MVDFSRISANLYNGAMKLASDAGTAVHGTFTKKNEETGKSEWNGKNVSIAVATGTAGLAAGIYARYGADPSAVLTGLKDDSSAVAGGVTSAFNYTVGGIASVVGRVWSAFTGVFNADNANSAYETLKGLPGQVATGFNSIKEQAAENFSAVMNKLNGIEAKIDGQGQ